MADRIAVIAPGAMGSGIAGVLSAHGADVVTLLDGRSEASRSRAERAGMRGVAEAELVESGLILSIVPPGQALALAQRLAGPLAAAARKPIVVDCNALDVATVRGVGAVIGAAGAAFVDGGIIGGPPKPGAKGPTLYLSGEDAQQVEATLGRLGIQARAIEGGVGAASALKMSYAGITKGITAIATIMVLGAARAGAGEALLAELRESQPQLLARFAKGLPDMVPKAYRWVAEMQEIAAFLEGDPAGVSIFQAAAELYDRIARDATAEREEVGELEAFAKRAG
jgi:3-hydroxyisobutyrate dehydrogenase-like beta-hydroxyacid dehydrogenase